jgi:DNA-binding beta-propeller fold protein YncE
MNHESLLRRSVGLAGVVAGLVASIGAPASAQEFPSHRLYVSSPIFVNNVFVFELDGTPVGFLLPPPLLAQPSGLAFGPGGELFVKAASMTTSVFSVDGNGNPTGPPISSGGVISGAGGLAFGPNGRLFAADVLAGEIQVYDPAGFLEDVLTAPGMLSPFGLALGSNGDLFVTNGGTQAVFQFDPSGVLLREISAAGLKAAGGIAIGPDGKIYVAEFNNDFVYVLQPDGGTSGAFTVPGLDGPAGLAFGPNGLLYVTAFNVNRIFAFQPGGTLEFDFDSLAPPQMIAVSPVRFGAKLKGTVASLTAAPEKRSESFQGSSGPVLSYFHGLGLAMLLLEDDPADGADLASRLGTDRLVFPGRVTTAGSKSAVLSADQIPEFGAAAGHVDLAVSGSTDAASGVFTPKKAKGNWSARSGDAHFQGQIQTGKPIQ